MQNQRKKPSREAQRKKKVVHSDDFVSVARRIGADEDKGRFEKMLGKIAKASPKQK